MKPRHAVLGMLLVFAGCKPDSSAKPSPSGTAEVASTGNTTANTAPAGSGPATPALLQEEEVRALIGRWESTQNQGQFDAYATLFAERFTGEKRVGPKLKRFNRADWLEDRKQLFAKPFTVRVDQLNVALSGTSAVVQFQQSWSNETFRDTGPKRIVVVRQGSDLRISSEEMLASTTGAKVVSEAVDPGEFSLMAPDQNDVLWLEMLPNLDAVTGHPEFVSNERARRPVAPTALPKARRELIGQRFNVYGEDGLVCEGVVEELFVDIALEPHFGTTQGWSGFDGATPVPEAERALGLWGLSEFGTRVLAARLKHDKPCDGALWARSAALKPATLWKQPDLTVGEEAAVWKAIRSEPQYRAIQQDYVSVTTKSTPWDETSRSRVLQVFQNEAGSTYVSVTLDSTYDDSCASNFDPHLFLLFQKHGTEFRAVSASMDDHVGSNWPRHFDPLHVDVAFDLDADGIPEFASKSDLVRSVNGKFRAVHNLSPSYYSCPC